MKLRFLLPATLIAFSCLFAFGQDETSEYSCTDCHSDLIEYNVMHYPAEDACDNCHMANGKEHPADGVSAFDLGDEMPALCFMCHETYTLTNQHAPSEMGECLMCHSPHGSASQGLLIQSSQTVLCAECHDMSIVEKSVKHGPVDAGSCSSCHDPHQSENSYLLKSEKRSMCLDCHETVKEEMALGSIHYPFEDDCSNCHETHSAEVKGLLTEKSPALCLNCHDMQSTVETAKVVHKILNDERGCANCHSPHASEQAALLLKDNRELCLDCHSKTIETEDRILINIGQKIKDGNMVHGAIDMDGCSVCHKPHAADQPFLLNSAYPDGLYAAATVENFELCFLCHDADLMQTETTDYATNFRNGTHNLHYLHINGEKGRNCNLCHDMHGSANAHLIADKVKFGNWDMPVGFTPNENGGSCLAGCHAEKKYSRLLQ